MKLVVSGKAFELSRAQTLCVLTGFNNLSL
jgi:hypothetical protein